MSEEEKLILSKRMRECIVAAQMRLYERKAKLGENVVIADSNGNPLTLPASELLRILHGDDTNSPK